MFEFTEDCKIGMEELDNEHRYLFELINDAYELSMEYGLSDYYQDVKEILAKLDDYAERHFEHEEAYMIRLCDPELPVQRSQHAYFRDKILSLDLHNIDDVEEQQRVIMDLVTFLAKWLYRHILSSDILIGKLPPLEQWMLKENPCEFTDEYLTGIDLIDKEHEQLFKIIGETEQLVKTFDKTDGTGRFMDLIKQLTEYTKYHFNDEEEYMESDEDEPVG